MWRVFESGRTTLTAYTLNMVFKNLILNAMRCNKCVDPDSEQMRIAGSPALPSVARNCWREEWCELAHKIRSISIPFMESEKSHESRERAIRRLNHSNPRLVLRNTTPYWLIIVAEDFAAPILRTVDEYQRLFFDVCVTMHYWYNNINKQLDATIITINNFNQLNTFRAIISPILRSTRLCLQLVL